MGQPEEHPRQYALVMSIAALVLSLVSIGLLYFSYLNANSERESIKNELSDLKTALNLTNERIADQQAAMDGLKATNSELSSKLAELNSRIEPQMMVEYRTGDPKDSSFNCALSNCAVAQSFVPTNDIVIDTVGAAFTNANGTIAFTIRSSPDGEVISATNTAPINKDGWTELPIEKQVVLFKGTQYFLQWDTVNDADTRFVYKVGNHIRTVTY